MEQHLTLGGSSESQKPRMAETSLRADIVLFSETSQQVVLLETTVPWEERREEAKERQQAKHAGMVKERCRQGWRERSVALGVGCRGFAAQRPTVLWVPWLHAKEGHQKASR